MSLSSLNLEFYLHNQKLQQKFLQHLEHYILIPLLKSGNMSLQAEQITCQVFIWQVF